MCVAIMLGLSSASAFAQELLPGGTGREPVTITAARLEYYSREKRAIYSGNVRAVQGDARLQCAKLEIFLADKGGSAGASNGGVKRMECFGPVTVTQKDQVGTGAHGTYDKGANSIVLTGSVTLSQGPNISVGDRLVYDLATGRARLQAGPSKARVQGIFESGSDAGAPGLPGAKRKTSGVVQ